MTRNEAEKAIAQILAQLETDCDLWVDGVNVVSFEKTSMNDIRRWFRRRVELVIRERPGSDWT